MLDDADICIGCYVWKVGQKPCKHNVNVSKQVWNLALLAAPTEQLDAARHFETADHKQYDKAVILYEKVCRKIFAKSRRTTCGKLFIVHVLSRRATKRRLLTMFC